MLRTPTLTNKIYQELRNRILNGEVTSGYVFKEEDLASAMDTSRTPVRTALKMLLSEGFLSQKEDRSLEVTTISMKELLETFEARKAVEGKIVQLASLRATRPSLERLEHFILDEKLALQERNRLLILAADRRFHTYLATMANNAILQDFQARLSNRMALYLALSSTLGDEVFYALEEHQRIVDAIIAEDHQEALRAMLDHIGHTQERMSWQIEKALV